MTVPTNDFLLSEVISELGDGSDKLSTIFASSEIDDMDTIPGATNAADLKNSRLISKFSGYQNFKPQIIVGGYIIDADNSYRKTFINWNGNSTASNAAYCCFAYDSVNKIFIQGLDYSSTYNTKIRIYDLSDNITTNKDILYYSSQVNRYVTMCKFVNGYLFIGNWQNGLSQSRWLSYCTVRSYSSYTNNCFTTISGSLQTQGEIRDIIYISSIARYVYVDSAGQVGSFNSSFSDFQVHHNSASAMTKLGFRGSKIICYGVNDDNRYCDVSDLDSWTFYDAVSGSDLTTINLVDNGSYHFIVRSDQSVYRVETAGTTATFTKSSIRTIGMYNSLLHSLELNTPYVSLYRSNSTGTTWVHEQNFDSFYAQYSMFEY